MTTIIGSPQIEVLQRIHKHTRNYKLNLLNLGVS